tara:strand:+ start:268 stop:678 length:411 start_codon:yes stop_codon:yes gene_type:complete
MEEKITEEEYMKWHIKRRTPKDALDRMRKDFREDFLMKCFYELENPKKELEESLMKMPELESEQEMQDRVQLMDMTSDEAHKYLLEDEEEQEEEPRSYCCGARFIGETGLCADCKEHADPQEHEVAPIMKEIFKNN